MIILDEFVFELRVDVDISTEKYIYIWDKKLFSLKDALQIEVTYTKFDWVIFYPISHRFLKNTCTWKK